MTVQEPQSEAAQKEALAILSEEASEVTKECMKWLRHGRTAVDNSVDPPTHYDNAASLERELGDLLAAAAIAVHVCGLDADNVLRACDERVMRGDVLLHHADISKLQADARAESFEGAGYAD